MHVTEVQDYFGTMEITEIDSFVVTSQGHPIYVIDGMTGSPLDSLNHRSQMVEVYGELVVANGDCGAGMECFDLDYGAGSTAIFRTVSGLQSMGDCIHWIGPLGDYVNAPQLDVAEVDWYRSW